jgi:hypothetical protein
MVQASSFSFGHDWTIAGLKLVIWCPPHGANESAVPASERNGARRIQVQSRPMFAAKKTASNWFTAAPRPVVRGVTSDIEMIRKNQVGIRLQSRSTVLP